MFFLKDKYKVGYKYGSPTYYGTKHLGIDYLVPTGTNIYAPFAGTVVKTFFGTDGGNTTWFKPDHLNQTFRFLHQSKFVVKSGHVAEGTLIGVSGNTGAETTAAHIHFDAFPGTVLPALNYTNFINPDTINWNPTPPMPPLVYPITLKVRFVANNMNWATLTSQLAKVAEWYRVDSNNRVNVTFDVVQTNFTSIPFETTDGNNKCVEKAWFRQNILPLAFDYDIIVLAVRYDEWDNLNSNNWGIMIGDLEPTKCMVINVTAEENEPNAHTIGGVSEAVPILVPRLEHEISHAFLGFTSQDFVNGENITHKYFLTVDGVDAHKIFDSINYQSLTNILAYRRGLLGEPMLIVHKHSDPNTKFALSSDTKIGFADFPAYQKFISGREVIDIDLADVEFAKIPLNTAVIKS